MHKLFFSFRNVRPTALWLLSSLWYTALSAIGKRNGSFSTWCQYLIINDIILTWHHIGIVMDCKGYNDRDSRHWIDGLEWNVIGMDIDGNGIEVKWLARELSNIYCVEKDETVWWGAGGDAAIVCIEFLYCGLVCFSFRMVFAIICNVCWIARERAISP